MELKINLSDREEIAAAMPLLQLILDATPKTCGGQCSRTVTHAVGEMSITNTISGDPAAVFGNSAPLPPSGAPSSAGAAPLPIAPEAMMAITSVTTTVPLPPVPTSAPAAVAPSVPAAPSTPAPAVELDVKGLPWDERIHAGSKGKLKDGTWRAKKEVDPAFITSVEAELRTRVAAMQGAAPEVLPVPVVPTVLPAAALPPAAPVVPSVSADPTTFEQLMPRITAAVTSGVLPPTAVGAACATAGLTSVVALQTSPQYVPHVWATLKQQYPGLA